MCVHACVCLCACSETPPATLPTPHLTPCPRSDLHGVLQLKASGSEERLFGWWVVLRGRGRSRGCLLAFSAPGSPRVHLLALSLRLAAAAGTARGGGWRTMSARPATTCTPRWAGGAGAGVEAGAGAGGGHPARRRVCAVCVLPSTTRAQAAPHNPKTNCALCPAPIRSPGSGSHGHQELKRAAHRYWHRQAGGWVRAAGRVRGGATVGVNRVG